LVAHEKHEDGGDHIHVYLHLNKKKDVRRADYFDVEGHHGNY